MISGKSVAKGLQIGLERELVDLHDVVVTCQDAVFHDDIRLVRFSAFMIFPHSSDGSLRQDRNARTQESPPFIGSVSTQLSSFLR